MNLRITLALALAMAFSGSFAQSHQQHHPQKSEASHGSAMPKMDMKKCMADMASGQARIDLLVQKMNSASSVDKADAVAAVVAEMVKQEKAMHEMCAMMMQMGDKPMMKMPMAGKTQRLKKKTTHHTA